MLLGDLFSDSEFNYYGKNRIFSLSYHKNVNTYVIIEKRLQSRFLP